jgi:4-hydroxybenzoate polyprenyltransferase
MAAMFSYLLLLRPGQWIKNTFVFAALLFGDRLLDPIAVEHSLLAFICFCCASSAGYIVNDILDRERDRMHPKKKNRPLASGAVPVGGAIGLGIAMLALAAIICSIFLPIGFWIAVSAYLFLTISYSLVLKHRMLIDVIVIAVLFVLRALAGAVAIEVEASPWLIICTFMLCLFLGFGKRRCEIVMIGNNADIKAHRETLVRYTPDLLTHLLSTSGGIAIVTFLLYTLDQSVPSVFAEQKRYLIYTLPLVVYGVFRYAMLIELGKASGPTEMIAKDPPFLIAILLWAFAAVAILYGGPRWFGA